MKKLLLILAACLVATSAQAQRTFSQAELDSLLAPIALHPDPLLSNILSATTRPADVAAAAQWSREHRQLPPEEVTRLAQSEPWHPAVRALASFPEILDRMDESPQWVTDLGDAFTNQQAQVMATVQGLRQRAQASGQLASTEHQRVYQQGEAIVIQPATQVVYVPYYDPYVVYGGWWWPGYAPFYWRPWAYRPVYVAPVFFHARCDWYRGQVFVPYAPVRTAPGFVPSPVHQRGQGIVNSRPSSPPPAVRQQPRTQGMQQQMPPGGPQPQFTQRGVQQRPMPQPVLRSTPAAPAVRDAMPQRDAAPVARNVAPVARGVPHGAAIGHQRHFGESMMRGAGRSMQANSGMGFRTR